MSGQPFFSYTPVSLQSPGFVLCFTADYKKETAPILTQPLKNAEYNLPGVIYEVRDERMNIYAYIDKELKPETELYAAPFFNVTGASICLGSAKIDKPTELTYDRLLEYWEKKFWLTEFSHLGGNGNPTKSNLVLVTKAAKNAPFNLEELKPLKNMKLKDILR